MGVGDALMSIGEAKVLHKQTKLPVMIVSYKDRPEDRARGMSAGADYYLTKGSFHDETLLDAVAIRGHADEKVLRVTIQDNSFRLNVPVVQPWAAKWPTLKTVVSSSCNWPPTGRKTTQAGLRGC